MPERISIAVDTARERVGAVTHLGAQVVLEQAVIAVAPIIASASLKQHLLQLGRPIPSQSRRLILDRIDFRAEAGERVGIVGRNGSGKTTLLKAVAGIFPLSAGRHYVNGRVGAVIAQGIGFDPELNLHHNIRLAFAHNRLFSMLTPDLEWAILEFAELSHLAETPLKRLSTGMQARLAFSVSLCQAPDILLLDEVFATGDAAFLEKARVAMLQRMMDSPITLVVSHSEDIVRSICNRAILIDEGRIIADGDPAHVLAEYRSRIS